MIKLKYYSHYTKVKNYPWCVVPRFKRNLFWSELYMRRWMLDFFYNPKCKKKKTQIEPGLNVNLENIKEYYCICIEERLHFGIHWILNWLCFYILYTSIILKLFTTQPTSIINTILLVRVMGAIFCDYKNNTI